MAIAGDFFIELIWVTVYRDDPTQTAPPSHTFFTRAAPLKLTEK